jgi:2-keto-3-deoxy-L-rhamnonate aldolase RhmA
MTVAQGESNRLVNHTKAKLRAGEVALGITVRISRTPDIARIAKSTGHDFIFIDGQHSIFNLESTIAIAHAALGIGLTCLVRVRNVDDPDASLLLDNGAAGIIYPDISTPAEAQKAVDMCKFPPIGKRSVVGGYPHFDFRSVPKRAATQRALPTGVHVETMEGLNNIEKIAAIKGVDVILSAATTCSPTWVNQKLTIRIVAAQERVIKAARDNGIIAGWWKPRCRASSQSDQTRCAFQRQTDIGMAASATNGRAACTRR